MKYAIVDIEEQAGIFATLPQLKVLAVLVDSAFTLPGPGDKLLREILPHFPALPTMLVSIEDNGFRAYAHFQTHTLLAYLQIPLIHWEDLDLSVPLQPSIDELPF